MAGLNSGKARELVLQCRQRVSVASPIARQLDRHLGHDPSRRRRQYEHPVGKLDRLAEIVGDKEYGQGPRRHKADEQPA